MNDNSLFRDPDGDPESLDRPGAAGQQGSKTASNTDSSPAEEDGRLGLEMAAQEQAQPCEQLIDEAVEETFPASDPPFWMPFGR